MRRVDVPLERSDAASVVAASVSTTDAKDFMVVVIVCCFFFVWLFLRFALLTDALSFFFVLPRF